MTAYMGGKVDVQKHPCCPPGQRSSGRKTPETDAGHGASAEPSPAVVSTVSHTFGGGEDSPSCKARRAQQSIRLIRLFSNLLRSGRDQGPTLADFVAANNTRNAVAFTPASRDVRSKRNPNALRCAGFGATDVYQAGIYSRVCSVRALGVPGGPSTEAARACSADGAGISDSKRTYLACVRVNT